jgi:hypothetical protein
LAIFSLNLFPYSSTDVRRSTTPRDRGRSTWQAQLFYFPSGPNSLTAFNFSGTGSRILSVTDTLAPGRYGFSVIAGSDSFGIGIGSTGLDYTFSLKFSDPQGPAPVPEPASPLLLGTGLAGIAGRQKLLGRWN